MTDSLFHGLPERFRYPAPAFGWLFDSFLGDWIFGERGRPNSTQAHAFGKMLLESDPLADRVAALDDEIGAAANRRLLERALDHGIDAVPDAPEPLVELFREVDDEPVWLDREQLALASALQRRAGAIAGFVLRDLALMGGYQSSALSKPLVFTGALDRGVDGRVGETSAFWIDVTRPGSLERFGRGRKTTVRIRVMHGRLRHRIRRHPDWSDDRWGIPINQGDLLSTNQAFSSGFLVGLRLFGMHISNAESEAVMHLWRFVGTLLGIRPEILPSTERDGWRILYLTAITHPEADDDSRALAQALLHEPRNARRNKSKLGAEIEAGLHHGVSRFLLDERTCRALGIPPTPWQIVPPLVALGMQPLEIARRLLPGGTRLAVAVGDWIQRSQLDAQLADRKAEYEPVRVLARDEPVEAVA